MQGLIFVMALISDRNHRRGFGCAGNEFKKYSVTATGYPAPKVMIVGPNSGQEENQPLAYRLPRWQKLKPLFLLIVDSCPFVIPDARNTGVLITNFLH